MRKPQPTKPPKMARKPQHPYPIDPIPAKAWPINMAPPTPRVSDPEELPEKHDPAKDCSIDTPPLDEEPTADDSDPEELPEKRIPAAKEVICSCRTAANTYVVKIVECYNPNCRIQWYHYGCLVKNSKLSSNHGKWVCEVCRSQAEWAEWKGDGIDVNKAWIMEEREKVVKNPYGLM
ncbi:hypothetical protein P280DRAFT_289718 [Massarina eburnea CBS 473.64]|uniref:Zinc finger PHD-type domain-containing protein n=1 Tax=Massarina eburnea CBS 473.64 TaxID=1395130 RepID=A0A6A6S6B3_9PLEO|nr:hypothetical protein P280DRAFT_289718 [Massarina eburnea CBS 473.64]